MKATVGSLVKLFYDSPREINVGEALKTMTGRVYLIAELRKQIRGAHIGRWHIKAIVLDEVPEGTKIHPIYWYRRKKRST